MKMEKVIHHPMKMEKVIHHLMKMEKVIHHPMKMDKVVHHPMKMEKAVHHPMKMEKVVHHPMKTEIHQILMMILPHQIVVIQTKTIFKVQLLYLTSLIKILKLLIKKLHNNLLKILLQMLFLPQI